MIKNAIWLFILTLVVLIVFLPSYTRMQELKEKNAQYRRQIENLMKKNEELRRETKLLEDDPIYLEKVAREKMGLVKEGEVVYKIKPAEERPDNGAKVSNSGGDVIRGRSKEIVVLLQKKN